MKVWTVLETWEYHFPTVRVFKTKEQAVNYFTEQAVKNQTVKTKKGARIDFNETDSIEWAECEVESEKKEDNWFKS